MGGGGWGRGLIKKFKCIHCSSCSFHDYYFDTMGINRKEKLL